MYKKSLIEEIVRIKEIMSVLTESAVTSDNPFTVLRRFIQELVGSGETKVSKHFGEDLSLSLEKSGVKNLDDLQKILSSGTVKLSTNEVNELTSMATKKIMTDPQYISVANDVVESLFKNYNAEEAYSLLKDVLKLDPNDTLNKNYIDRFKNSMKKIFGTDYIGNYIDNYHKLNTKITQPTSDTRVKQALDKFKFSYIKNNTLDNYNSLVKNYKNKVITTDQFVKFLETGSKINLLKPLKKVYEYKGVKFSEQEYDNIINLVDKIEDGLKNKQFDTRYSTEFGTIKIKTERGETSSVIGYTNDWVDNIGKQNSWSDKVIDNWKNAGGMAPHGTPDVYVNMSQPYQGKTFLRDLLFHEYGHMKDPALIPERVNKYMKNYDPSGFPMNKKYFYHQGEKTANISAYFNSLNYHVNRWISLGFTKDVMITKLNKLKKMLQSGNIRVDDLQDIFGKDYGFVGRDLSMMLNAQRGMYSNQKKEFLTKFYVQIDLLILKIMQGK